METRRSSSRSAFAALAVALLASLAPALGAEQTTGAIVGMLLDAQGHPVDGARIAAASPSGTYLTVSDRHGAFAVLGVIPDTYTISVQARGFEPATRAGVAVLPGQTQRLAFVLVAQAKSLGIVRVTGGAFVLGAPNDVFTVTGQSAGSSTPPVAVSGLSTYTAGTVQGAIASVPGVTQDPFANAILRGGKVEDAVFEFDSVAVPQALVAEPGGNVVGSQLPDVGVGSTTVTLAGYQDQADNALGGVIDEIPATGTYPGSGAAQFTDGLAGTQTQLVTLQSLEASPDQRWRYALAVETQSQYLTYGDGRTFYPAEAATYGLALQSRGGYGIETNVHDRLGEKDDLSLLALVSQTAYDQYATPYAGETFGAFDGTHTTYPGSTDPDAAVTFASGIRGRIDVFKAAWLHTGARSLSRVQAYESSFGDSAGGPYWDENGFPNGTFSFSGEQQGRLAGFAFDGEDLPSDWHHLRYGIEYRVNTSSLNQIVPTFDEVVRSNPTVGSALVYAGDTWSPSERLDLLAAGRLMHTHFSPSMAAPYDVNALDPHLGLAYRVASGAFRATFDHTTVPPEPLEVDRSDSTNVDAHGNPAPFVALSPETADQLSISVESSATVSYRLSYFADLEKNRIDVLPFNFRQVVAGEALPSPVGVPTNAGELEAHGLELWMQAYHLTLDTDYVRAFSSSASQFAYNDLNAPAVAAGHLFPVGYIPNLSATLTYELDLFRQRLRLMPSLSYESGYPFGVGTMAWVFNALTHQPMLVPNDNHVDPGSSYYFLRDPSLPFDALSNPYIGDLGTAEGSDPNTLRSIPQLLANLHVEAQLDRRWSTQLDVTNLLGTFGATAYQTNPYLIGPPGYAGGDPLYATYYQSVIGSSHPYVLGNGVPTDNGADQAVPWSYGRNGYVPQSYPASRAFQLGLRYRV